MAFAVEWSERALRKLDSIERKDAVRIIEKVGEAAKNPLHYFVRLSGRAEYKLRVGDYRLIAHISTNENRISILLVGHRKNVYEM